MTPKKLMKKAMTSSSPVARALHLIELEFSDNPDLAPMLDAVYEVYLRHRHPYMKGSFSQFIRWVERREKA